MPTLTADGLTAGYRSSAPVLKNLSFSAASGEFIGILGPNGCGKTTLLRTAAGSLRPQSGSLLWDGVSLAGLSVRERALIAAYLPQDPPTAEGISAMEEIEFGLCPSRGLFFRRTPDDTAKILALAEEYGVSALLDRPLNLLSGGERQAASLLRAEIQDTPILLLDEPFGALDFSRSAALFRRLEALAGERNKLILAVLHDPTAALAHCGRILLMKDGAVLRELRPAEESADVLEEGLRLLYPELRIAESGGARFCTDGGSL